MMSFQKKRKCEKKPIKFCTSHASLPSKYDGHIQMLWRYTQVLEVAPNKQTHFNGITEKERLYFI